MFDEHAQRVIAALPQLPGLDPVACRRALSAAYFVVVQQRLGATTSEANIAEVRLLLRRLVDALESVAVFDRLAGSEVSRDTEQSAAFVAGEALSLLASLSEPEHVDIEAEPDEVEEEIPAPIVLESDAIQQPEHYIRFEAALLYFIAGYEINGLALMQDLAPAALPPGNELPAARQANAIFLVSRLRDLCVGRITAVPPAPYFVGFDAAPSDHASIVSEVRLWIYRELGIAISSFLQWLGGYENGSYEEALARTAKVRQATSAERPAESAELPVLGALQSCGEFADMYHLASLLHAAFERAGERSFFHQLPRPVSGSDLYRAEFENYCAHRVRGSRPFLWPTALEFVEKALPEFTTDAVISMPTGSGKSSVAEIAITHALSRGDVIYLAPTNALVHQIRRDLEHALRPFADVKIVAFVGSGEYTRLAEEEIIVGGERFVGVMTPEKCALAMRLNPEVFSECSLCIFDECHLINDGHRGVVADLLLAQLFQAAPTMRVLLMSAMVGNADEISAWLHVARGAPSYHSETRWRPSRALRGLVVVNRTSAISAFKVARSELLAAIADKKKRKNWEFEAELAVVAGLSGPWTKDGALDYRASGAGVTITARASVPTAKTKSLLGPVEEELRKADGKWIAANIESWKNVAGRLIAERLARAGIATINFILSSRHHAFSCAEMIEQPLPGSFGTTQFPPLIEAWLTLADAELGQPTVLRKLLAKGVAVHTSAMLQVEQAASEWMFSQKHAGLMFATGTLAQGLNLPAVGVVISGTSMGDPRDTDKIAGIGREEAMILNAFGRAGRPGFANQGLAVLVSDTPYTAPIKTSLDGSPALLKYPQLGLVDAAVTIGSPIERFIDQMALVGSDVTAIPEQELELVTQLAETPETGAHAGEVLRRTFGGYRKRAIFTDALSNQLRDRIMAIRQDYFAAQDVPSWLNRAAMEAGVDFFRAHRIWQSYQHRGAISVEVGAGLKVSEWCGIFFEVMRGLPPARIRGYMADEDTKTVSMLTRLRDAGSPLLHIDTVPWTTPTEWLQIWQDLQGLTEQWLNGETFTALAQTFCSLETVVPDRSSAKPLPTIFAVVRNVFEPLARDAGCLVSLIEHDWQSEIGEDIALAEELEALPLCLRSGCGSMDALAWYRFGYRQRRAAHVLAKLFPVPEEIATDTERANWIRESRSESLLGETDLSLIDPLLESVRTILRQGVE